MNITVKTQSFSKANQSVLVVGVFSNNKKEPVISKVLKPFAEDINALAKDKVFTGEKDSFYFLRKLGGQSVLFFGLGEAKDADTERVRCAGATVYKSITAEKVTDAAVSLDSFTSAKGTKGAKADAYVQAFTEGALLSTYTFDKYKSEAKPSPKINLALVQENRAATTQKAVDTAEACVDAVFIARDLSNEPGSAIYPATLAKEAERLAKKYGVRCKVLDVPAIKKEKMGGLMGVGQGSTRTPRFIILEYKPKTAKRGSKKLAFVGKAITFDSGGISIKPSPQMEDMKHDMSGGANMIAATLLAAKLKSPNAVTAYIAAAENMPSGTAIVPSTVLHTRSGKTIEVLNTDAEGRLVLADALDYAQDAKPDYIIDAATLTGAVVIALGAVCSAIMGNDQKMIDKFASIAEKTGEKHWQLPIFKEYTDDMKGSKIADLRNIGGDRSAGSSKAGAFLQEFVKNGTSWMHIDCAGSAWNQRHLPYAGTGATGHGVRTLAEFACSV